MKIYIGCSLTHATPEFRSAVEEVQNQLRGEYEVLDFLGLVKGTAADAYHRDIGVNIATCDLFVAICDHPSLGLGYEIATAVEKHGKPVLALAQQDAVITRLILGIDARSFEFQRYERVQDIPQIVRQFISDRNLA